MRLIISFANEFYLHLMIRQINIILYEIQSAPPQQRNQLILEVLMQLLVHSV